MKNIIKILLTAPGTFFYQSQIFAQTPDTDSEMIKMNLSQTKF
jgi:hypothetical protein